MRGWLELHSLSHRNEELHLVLKGVVQRRHLRRGNVRRVVSVHDKQAAEPQHMSESTAQSLYITHQQHQTEAVKVRLLAVKMR